MAVMRLYPTSYTISRNPSGSIIQTAEALLNGLDPEVGTFSCLRLRAAPSGSPSSDECPCLDLLFTIPDALKNVIITKVTAKVRYACYNGRTYGNAYFYLNNHNTGNFLHPVAKANPTQVQIYMGSGENNYSSVELSSSFLSTFATSTVAIRIWSGFYNEDDYIGNCVLDIEYTPTNDLKIGVNKLKKAFLGSTAIQKIYKGVQLLYDSAGALPAEYQQVTFIGFDGTNSGSSSTPYIDTGIVPSATKGFYLDANITQGASGSSDGANGKTMIRGWSDNTELYWDGDVDKKQPYVVGRHTWTIDYYNHRVGYDTTYDTISNPTTGYATATFFLGAWHEWGTAYYGMAGRVYGFKVYDNGTLIADYIPCYRVADNEVGLYDIVNNQFYTNQGTGSFTKGPDVN